MARHVVVLSDGSGVADDHATSIEELTGLPARVVPLASGGSLEHVLDGLPGAVGAVFLAHTEHDRAAKAQAGATRVPVITVQDTIAIAVAAALLIALNQAGQTPQTSRVVLAGEQTLPILCPLLVAAGVGDITTWDPADAVAFPLRRITADAHAVITFPAGPGGQLSVAGTAEDGTIVIVAGETRLSTIAAAGLSRAIVDLPEDRCCRLPDLEIYLACVLALAAPWDRPSQPGADRALAARVTDAVLSHDDRRPSRSS
jgi:malate dehydrogenase (oxaloacetate-decarboxylating)